MLKIKDVKDVKRLIFEGEVVGYRMDVLSDVGKGLKPRYVKADLDYETAVSITSFSVLDIIDDVVLMENAEGLLISKEEEDGTRILDLSGSDVFITCLREYCVTIQGIVDGELADRA